MAAGATLQIGNGGTTGSLFPGQSIIDNGAVVFNRSDAFSFGNVISGMGSVTQAGSNALTLSVANTYTGATTVNSGGTLIAGNNSSFGVNSAMTIGATGLVQLVGRNVTLGSLAGGGTLENANATNVTLTLGGNNTSTDFSGTLRNGTGAGTLAVTKNGTGTQTLSGTNSFTGTLSINAGAVSVSGGLSSVTINVGGAASASGILNVLPGASLNLTGSITPGAFSASSGAIRQSGGDVVVAGQMIFGIGGLGAYGSYDISGGTLSAGDRFRVGGGGTGLTGVFYQSGGDVFLTALTNNNGLEIGANASGPFTDSRGVGYLTGGTLNAIANSIGYNATGGGAVRGEQTVAGNAAVTINGITTLGQTTNDVGILNLNGGTYATKTIVKGTGIVNFNGGILKAAASSTGATFFTGLTSANIYSGGLTVDTNGQDLTVGQALLAPVGKGVTTIPVSYGGIGYVGAPWVSISGGGGNGATAVASMIDDGTGNGTFKIASITIASPGTGYTGTPTVTVVGGGGGSGWFSVASPPRTTSSSISPRPERHDYFEQCPQ